MGVVYKARQLILNRIVAVKMILAGSLANEAEVRRFESEAQLAAQLQHPHIVAIHEIGKQDGQPYFSMDYVQGRDLARVVADLGSPMTDFIRVARWVKAITEAIAYAHQRGVLHRDLKPSNVLIDELDQPRLTDFGIAKRISPEWGAESAELTVTGQVLGSPGFMSPEQVTARPGQVGFASDIYSIGATTS
jgi:serine/threonine-protein kinase